MASFRVLRLAADKAPLHFLRFSTSANYCSIPLTYLHSTLAKRIFLSLWQLLYFRKNVAMVWPP
jgi:hypothetical protein